MKVLIADDDVLVLDALKTILEKNDIEVKYSFTCGKDILETKAYKNVDVIILDIRMKEENGVDIAIEILKNDKNCKILLLTTFNDTKDIERGLKKGCLGIILKDNIESLIPSIHSVSFGNKVIDASLNLISNDNKNKKSFENLTKKENEILEKIAMGLSNKEIAKELFLSEGTVRNYVSIIFEKLNIENRTKACIFYYNKDNN